MRRRLALSQHPMARPAARGLVARLTWALFKRETVGVDALGNRYTRALDRTPEGEVW